MSTAPPATLSRTYSQVATTAGKPRAVLKPASSSSASGPVIKAGGVTLTPALASLTEFGRRLWLR
eukprot:10213061-Prorocentrum_lima.AAC.1